METTNQLTALLGHDNAARQRAEAELASQRTSAPQALLQLFVNNLKNGNIEAKLKASENMQSI